MVVGLVVGLPVLKSKVLQRLECEGGEAKHRIAGDEYIDTIRKAQHRIAGTYTSNRWGRIRSEIFSMKNTQSTRWSKNAGGNSMLWIR
jgi:hypothetical protein